MKVLLIDNYDSFTYNIVELLRQLNVHELSIYKNDEIGIKDARHFDKIILSPGPATPSESGNMLDIIKVLSPTHSILGICLGHQAIAEAFGASLRNEPVPYHGFQTNIHIVNEHRIFRCPTPVVQVKESLHATHSDLPSTKNNLRTSNIEFRTSMHVGLYHSWTVDEKNFPSCLEITSYSNEKNIMSIRHKEYDVHGMQFHPESYMTEYGKEIMGNFLNEPY